MKIFVKVIPNSKITKVVEDIVDMLGERTLKVKVRAIPENGKANEEVIEVISDYFKVKKRDVLIERGMNSRSKIIEIKNI